MKILLALNNEFVENKIREKYGEDVYKYELYSMEEVIEFLRDKEEYIVITKDTLEGNLDPKMYIRQMKLVCPNVKVIYIVKHLENEYKQFLFANEVFNILESSSLNINNIIESIEEDSKVVYKDSSVGMLSEPGVEYKIKIKNQILSKKKIAIYGTSGAGKSLVSSLVSRKISKDLKISLALLDMDIQNPSIDIFKNIDQNNDGLNQIVDDLDKKKNVNDVIQKYMIKDKNNKDLWYMTNNVSIFDVQNKLSNKYYEKIYDSMYKNFDFLVIDLPSSPFLDVVPYSLKTCDYIFFVINPNYTSIRQAIKYLDLLTKLWGIRKDKIKLIVNKIQKNSLENVQIQNLLENYEIVLNIPYIKEIDSYINGAVTDINIEFNMRKIFKSIGINEVDENENINFNIKSLLRRVGVGNGS